MCVLDNGLTITPYHPILYQNVWTFPSQLIESSKINCDYMYNLVLNDRKSIYVEGIICCTLGHGINGDVIGHPFFGTELIIENLKEFVNQYEKGLVYYIQSTHRDPNTGMICRYE